MANNFKDKIRDISNDNTINVGYFTCTAYVSEASEVSNTCTITYIDSNGNQRTQKMETMLRLKLKMESVKSFLLA